MNKSPERIVAVLLGITCASNVAFAVVYAFGAQTQAAAACLAVGFLCLAAGMVVYEHRLMPRRDAIEERGSLPSDPETNAETSRTFLDGWHDITDRRAWLVAIFGSAVGTLGIALLFPFRSFAPRTATPGTIGTTSWKSGARLVREDGTPVKAADLAVNSVLTVFPEGRVGPQFADTMTNDATILVRVPADELHPTAERAGWAPDGLIAYSKVCTHAGCPVGLYRAAARQLFCPCHQSTFDVLAGGAPIFGPAPRPLPQLPLRIAADGTLEAQSGFPEPVGPTYWERT